MLKRLSVVVLVACTLACSNEQPVLRVTTEGTSFDRNTVGPSSTYASVPFDVRNVSDASVWIPACGATVSVIVQRWVALRWSEYSGTICVAFLPMNPIMLRSGQTTTSAFQIPDSGIFRFGVSYGASADQRDGERWSYSNPFEVR
jgi:hypothetical protein